MTTVKQIPIEWFSQIQVGDTHKHILPRKLSKDDCSEEAMNRHLESFIRGEPPPMTEPDIEITRVGENSFMITFDKGFL